MKRRIAGTTLCLIMTVSGILASTLPEGKPYKEFQIGVTGLNADITDGKLSVTKVTPDTPAATRGFKAGDELLSVNGESLKVQDPRHVLGAAINEAEGKDGKMVFEVRRGTEQLALLVQLDPIGSYSKTWPLNCKKSDTIIKNTAEFILKAGPCAGITGYLDGLFLLSTGIPKYTEAAARWANEFSTGTCGSSTWNNGYHGLFLGEYYLATGDKNVLPTLKSLCEDATARQYFGGWNHGGGPAGPGYVQGGLMNPAGVQVLTSLILARECGVEFDESTYDKALSYFYRFAGHGGVAYGNHPPEGMNSNGKNGMLACALTLLPQAKFQGAAQIMALAEADTYAGSEGGHGSHFGNVTWRGIAGALVPEHKAENYRRHMDNLIWYYDLCRMPQGGLTILPQPSKNKGFGRSPNYCSGMIGLAYTAPLKTLRITGKPRTKFSVTHKPTEVEQNLEYTDFHKTDYAEGGGDDGLEPPELSAKLSVKRGQEREPMPAEWYLKMMHHYQSDIRQKAALALGELGPAATPQILAALKSPDARVRTAGLNAINGVQMWWFYRQSVNNAVEQKDVNSTFLPYILKPLKDPDAPMWEKVNALWALGKADAEVVTANIPLVKGYLKHEDWWVRVGAWEALKPLTTDPELLRPVLPDLLECYANELIVHPNRAMMGRLRAIRAQNASLSAEVIAAMVKGANEVYIAPGYKQNIYINKIFEQLRYIDMKTNPENAVLMVDSARRIMKVLRGQQVAWLFTGARWGNIGLVNAANKLGKDAKPIIAGLKAMIPDIQRAATGKSKAAVETALAAVNKCIQDYEAEYGVVEPAGPVVEPPEPL